MSQTHWLIAVAVFGGLMLLFAWAHDRRGQRWAVPFIYGFGALMLGSFVMVGVTR